MPTKLKKKQSKPENTMHLDFFRKTGESLSSVLGSVAGELDYGLSTTEPKSQRRAMYLALGALEKAMRLAKNLRYLSRPSQFQMAEADLTQILLETLEQFEPLWESKGIRHRVLAEAPAPTVVDVASIRHTIEGLANLVAMALPKGGEVSVFVKHQNKNLQLMFNLRKTKDIWPQISQELEETLTTVRAVIKPQGGKLIWEGTKPEKWGLTLPALESPSESENFQSPRRAPRVSCFSTGSLQLNSQPLIQGSVTILSQVGCFFSLPTETVRKLPSVQTEGSLELDWGTNHRIKIPKIRLVSRLCEANRTGAGIEFLEVPLESEKVITALVKSLTL